MLPSKEKFQYYNCPFYAYDGSCDRPFCHFKHSEPQARQEENQGIDRAGEECPAGCVCTSQSQQNGTLETSVTASKQSAREGEDRAVSVPQYHPTPIVELEKRSINMDSLAPAPTATYNPSDMLLLDIKQEVDDGSDSLPPTYGPVKVELEEELKIKTEPHCDWELNGGMSGLPVKSEYLPWAMIPIDEPPSSPSLDEVPIKCEPETTVVTERDEYTLCTNQLGSGLEYKPTTSSAEVSFQTIQLEYNPSNIQSVMSVAPSAVTPASYIPTERGKLSKAVEAKSGHSSSGKRHKHKSSSHSSSSGKKRHRDESPEPKNESDRSKKHRSEPEESKKHSGGTNKSSKNREELKKKHRSDPAKKDEEKDKKRTSHSKSSTSHRSNSSHGHRSSGSEKSTEKGKKKSHTSSTKDRDHKTERKHPKSSSSEKSISGAKVSESPTRDPSPPAPDSEESQDNIMKQCFNIFEAFELNTILAEVEKPVATAVAPTNTGESAEETEPLTSSGKKRVAYAGAEQAGSKPKLVRSIRPVPKTAGVVLAERYKRQQAELQGNSGVHQLLQDLTGPTTPSTATSTKVETPQKTAAQSFGKGKPRVAHKVKEELLQRPIVDASTGDRIPFPRRQHVLDKFVDACLQKFATTEEAYEKALELEQACFVKSLSVSVYNNLFVSNMLKLKRADESSQGGNTRQQLELSLDRGVIKKTVVNRDYNFRGVELYKRLTRYLLTEEDLKMYSYPMVPQTECEPGRASVYNIDKNRLATHTGPERDCSRCRTSFVVDKHGMPKELSKDELCIFHPKRAFPRRVRGCLDYYYDCCGLPMGAEGCESCKYHVSEKLDVNNLHGFVQTFQKDGPAQASGVYALDCEMCVTTEGSSLTRITVIDDNSSVVYDTLVKPDKPILDYCTRYSGVDEKMLRDIKCTLRDVQSVLLNMFSKDTILIGHSLNSDLMVLKLIHYNVIDTSIVFPHKEGPPKRRALKNVAKDYLFRLIQQEESGHDSKEDAVACMDLMKLKVKEAAKLE